MTKILMVCMGNICRSPMARVVAQQLARNAGLESKFVFDAAGTHVGHSRERIDPRARKLLEARGYGADNARSRRIESKDFERFDLILAMDKTNLADLERQCPTEFRDKLGLLLDFTPSLGVSEVPDPYYGNMAGFEHVLTLCEAAATGLLAAHGTRRYTL